MVRLKVFALAGGGRYRDSFNSIVVRLKDLDADAARELPREFQFHSGSIKSKLYSRIGRRIEGFQFHSGSIKSGRSQSLRARAK